MRIIDSASLWGNMYQHRYYVNGKRIDKDTFERAYLQVNDSWIGSLEGGNSTFYRMIWESK